MRTKVDQQLERIEAAARFVMAEVRALGELLAEYPRFKGEVGKELERLADTAVELASQLYGVEATLRCLLPEENSAKVLRKEVL